MDCQIRLSQGYNTTVGSYGNKCAQADCLPLRCKYAEMLHDVARCLIHSSILRRDVWEPAGSSTISSMWKTHHFVDHFPIGENSLAFPQLTARAFYVFLRLFVSPKRLGFLDLSGSFWQVASMVCPLNLDHHTLNHPGFVWRSCGTCPLKRSEWAPRTTTEPRPFSSCFFVDIAGKGYDEDGEHLIYQFQTET